MLRRLCLQCCDERFSCPQVVELISGERRALWRGKSMAKGLATHSFGQLLLMSNARIVLVLPASCAGAIEAHTVSKDSKFDLENLIESPDHC